MTYHLNTSPLSAFWSGSDPRSAGLRCADYAAGMVSFALSLPIRVAILAIRVLKAIVAIVYAIFGTLSQDRAKNWKECGNELIRLGGSIAELLSGCLGVLAPPLAYRVDLKLYENPAIRDGAIFTVRKEFNGVRFKPSTITPFPEEVPAPPPVNYKPYVRGRKMQVSAPAPVSPQNLSIDSKLESMRALIDRINAGFLGENGEEFKARMMGYIANRVAIQTAGPHLGGLLNPTQGLSIEELRRLMDPNFAPFFEVMGGFFDQEPNPNTQGVPPAGGHHDNGVDLNLD